MINPETDIEWEMAFVKAEQTISRNLHYPKLRKCNQTIDIILAINNFTYLCAMNQTFID